ncbi:MAG: hypothetical protein OYH77_06855 [Pseudomonadota bacterium]|nr:hypothetical protein [Pseudomonadota bacterium]
MRKICLALLLCSSVVACIIEQKSEGKFAAAFAASMRIAARNSDAYIKKVIATTHQAIISNDISKLKSLFSGQDSSTAIRAYRDFVDDKLQASASIGKIVDILISDYNPQHGGKLTTSNNRAMLGFAKQVDDATAALDVHISLMREEHTDLRRLIAVNTDTRALGRIASAWREASNSNQRLIARKIDYVTYQRQVIEQVGKQEWVYGRDKFPTTLTNTQREFLTKEKIWSRENLQDAVLKRLATIRRINDASTTFLTNPTTKRTLEREASLRQEIELLLDVDNKFLRQLN